MAINKKLYPSGRIREKNGAQLHSIAAVGSLEQPNGTSLAQHLRMTRDGISKNIKKLTEAGLVIFYQPDGNTKNDRLTDSGGEIYEKHSEAHEARLERDRKFMENFSHEQLRRAEDFLKKIYAAYGQ